MLTVEQQPPANASPINWKKLHPARLLLTKARWFCKVIKRGHVDNAIILDCLRQAEEILESLQEFSEAKYYLAYVYSVQKKTAEAMKLLSSLASSKNAYTAKAAVLLGELQAYEDNDNLDSDDENDDHDNDLNENDQIAWKFKVYCLDLRFGYELARDPQLRLSRLQKHYFILKAADAGHPQALIDKIKMIELGTYSELSGVKNSTVITSETTFDEYIKNIKLKDAHKQLTPDEKNELWVETLKQAAKVVVKDDKDTYKIVSKLYEVLPREEFEKLTQESDQFYRFATIFLGKKLISKKINGEVPEENKIKGVNLLIKAIDLEWEDFQDAIYHVKDIISLCESGKIKIPVDILQMILDKSIAKFVSAELAITCGVLYLEGGLGFVCDFAKAGAYFYRVYQIDPSCLEEIKRLYSQHNKKELYDAWVEQYQRAEAVKTYSSDEDSESESESENENENENENGNVTDNASDEEFPVSLRNTPY